MNKKYILPVFLLLFLVSSLFSQKKRTIIFDEKQIEGKLRRPQLVLIKAEQRPEFSPMVMQSLDSDVNAVRFSKETIVEESPYGGAFIFNGHNISNYTP